MAIEIKITSGKFLHQSQNLVKYTFNVLEFSRSVCSVYGLYGIWLGRGQGGEGEEREMGRVGRGGNRESGRERMPNVL